MDVSLFERLIHNGASHVASLETLMLSRRQGKRAEAVPVCATGQVTLLQQRRMHPKISRLIKPRRAEFCLALLAVLSRPSPVTSMSFHLFERSKNATRYYPQLRDHSSTERCPVALLSHCLVHKRGSVKGLACRGQYGTGCSNMERDWLEPIPADLSPADLRE